LRVKRRAFTSLRCKCARLFDVLALLLTCLLSASPSLGQDTPFVPDEWKFGRRHDGSNLHYCVDARDPDLPVARKIGEAIALALLLQPQEHLMGEKVVAEDLDNIYRVFLETCDLYLGFKLIPDAYPQWLTVTRPYYRVSYVFATISMEWKSFAEVPKSQAIGATIGTSADLRRIQYLQSLPASERWNRFPMSSDEFALRALLRGTVGAALVWGPALWALQLNTPEFAKVRTMAPNPLPASAADVGAALLSNATFLRTSVDQAITSLTADGTIQRILDGNKFPGFAVP
jgi:polar amino acid transport system substrate-binding protein